MSEANPLSLDLKSVTVFTVVQADDNEVFATAIVDEKEFSRLEDALKLVQTSEAPIRYLMFNHSGEQYKLYPIENSEEYQVVKSPILN